MPGTTEILESPTLSKHGFVHGFSLRAPDPASVLRGILGARPLYQANQVHGAAVVLAEGDVESMRKRDADALVARAPSAVGVRVADCVPVLVAALDTGNVAAIHAGWRGIVKGVIPAALDALGCDGHTRFIAAIGPCIGQCCFEVGLDVAAQIEGSSHGVTVVARSEGGKAHIDLRAAVRAHLVHAGLSETDIEDVHGCTKCDASRFFSFRRDGANAGRQLGVIAAREPRG